MGDFNGKGKMERVNLVFVSEIFLAITNYQILSNFKIIFLPAKIFFL